MEQILLMILTRIEKYREGGGGGKMGKGEEQNGGR